MGAMVPGPDTSQSVDGDDGDVVEDDVMSLFGPNGPGAGVGQESDNDADDGNYHVDFFNFFPVLCFVNFLLAGAAISHVM